MNHRDRSTNERPALPHAPVTSTARRPASHAPAISRARAARRFRATCFADGRTGLPASLGFVILADQPFHQANAVSRTPALINFGLRRAHPRSPDLYAPPATACAHPPLTIP